MAARSHGRFVVVVVGVFVVGVGFFTRVGLLRRAFLRILGKCSHETLVTLFLSYHSFCSLSLSLARSSSHLISHRRRYTHNSMLSYCASDCVKLTHKLTLGFLRNSLRRQLPFETLTIRNSDHSRL